MNIQTLLPDSHRGTAIGVAEHMLLHPEIMDEMMQMAFSNKGMLSTRAANVIEKADEMDACFVRPYYKTILEALPSVTYPGVKRCLLKIFSREYFPGNEDMAGLLMSYCFDTIQKPKEEVAIRYYCMMILHSQSQLYPEIATELKLILEEQLPHYGAALQNRAGKIIKDLEKKKSER
jgi:hypothetical protein